MQLASFGVPFELITSPTVPSSKSPTFVLLKPNKIAPKTNNGSRFHYWIHRRSHSIPRCLFNHPMYAKLIKINISSILLFEFWFWIFWLQIGLCWRLQRKSFLGLLWLWVFLFICVWCLLKFSECWVLNM